MAVVPPIRSYEISVAALSRQEKQELLTGSGDPLRGLLLTSDLQRFGAVGPRSQRELYTTEMFPLDRWYVAGFSWEFGDKPAARTLLGRPVVLFRANGKMAALEDRSRVSIARA